jgi:hypothetical protein
VIKPVVISNLSQPKKGRLWVRDDNGRIKAVSSQADDVVERSASKALAGGLLTQTSVMKKPRAARAPQLSNLERELRELKQVVEALAVRSVVHDHEAQVVDFEGMTLLDADTANQLLDNPGEPNEALSAILALR